MRKNLAFLFLSLACGAAETPMDRLTALPWLGDGRSEPASEAAFYAEDPAPEFRASVVLPPGEGDVAVQVVCAGYCEVRLNGRLPKAGGTDVGTWSVYERTLYADRLVFDAAARRPAADGNVLTVTLGNGFYNLPPLRFWDAHCFRAQLAHGRPCFKAYVEGTGDSPAWRWRATRIVRNGVYLGEEIDATRAEAEAWRPAVKVPGPRGRIRPRTFPATVAGEGVAGVARWVEPGRVQVVDFGVNATARPQFVFAGQKKGTRIEILYGERLLADGRVNVLTQTAGQIKRAGEGGPGAPVPACQRDVYICGGGAVETFAPRFAWHVYRYAEVRGCDRLLPGRAARTKTLAPAFAEGPAAARAARLEPDLARLHAICRRTFLANAMGGIQSDCPGRERLGYGGDIVATCEAYMLNWDMREFYLKTLQDFADEAAGDGWLTETAPYVGLHSCGFGGRAGPISWTVAVPVLMDALMRHYPDTRDRVLAFYPVCARYVKLVDAACPDGLVPRCIGDHEALERAPDGVTATAHWHLFVSLTAAFAAQLGRTAEAAELTALAAKIRAAFQRAYVKEGVVANGTQSAQAIALYLGLVPSAQVAAAEQALVAAVERAGCAPTTGIFATRYMLMYLSEHGRRDLAARIVRHRGFPGWLHMLERGATTLWETWKESDDVYSNCHPMFGSVDEWILRFGTMNASR